MAPEIFETKEYNEKFNIYIVLGWSFMKWKIKKLKILELQIEQRYYYK